MTYASGYDVIVCGSGSNHLFLSALLASRGVNPLVISGLNGKRFERDGYQFPEEYPLFIDFGPGGILGELFSDIDLPLSFLKGEEQLFRDLSPAFQVVLPDYRIDIFQEEEDLLDELCRELKEEGGKVISLFNEVNKINSLMDDDGDPSLFRKIKALIKRVSLSEKNGRAVLNPFNPSARLIRFFDLLSLAFYGYGIEEIGALGLLSIIRMLKGGGRSIMGGVEALNDLLMSRIKSNGGAFYDGDIAEFVMKGRRISGVRTSSGDHFDCKMVVMEGDIERPGFTKERPKRFSLYFGVDKDFVPPPMGEYLVVSRDYSRECEEDNLLMLSLSPLNDPRWAPADKRGIIATTFVSTTRDLSVPYVGELRNHVMESLVWLMPFSQGQVEFVSDDLTFGRIKDKSTNPLSSLPAVPRNLYLIGDGRNAWIRTSEDLNAFYKTADQILRKV